jgi:hypothetical protein
VVEPAHQAKVVLVEPVGAIGTLAAVVELERLVEMVVVTIQAQALVVLA